ncbi:MAG: methyltransferase domain-containing protein [Gammaproteobacteria bacterium]|nr:methyltransferase domain-containing protein [Gammaproteobacteria bacterium]
MHYCRHCASALELPFIDLGHQPPSNAYLTHEQLDEAQCTYPLKVYTCTHCWLVQSPAHAAPNELFTEDYAYFSSMSQSCLTHARDYVTAMQARFGLDSGDLICEIASNDGYLLQYALADGMRILGVEPTAAAAQVARGKGIRTETRFFGTTPAAQLLDIYGPAALMPANNVLAHVPDINDFAAGFAVMLAPEGVATFEFPHLMSLLGGLQFDTIYHEHYSYLSLIAVTRILTQAGLRIFDVEELATHGGSLRVFACRERAAHETQPTVADFLRREEAAGLKSEVAYGTLQRAAETIKNDLLTFLIRESKAGRRVAGYGAAAKGNTLLNFSGVRRDLLSFVCDRAPLKQGRYLPGSHIPICSPEQLAKDHPDTVLILPWNIAAEVVQQQACVREWGGRFAVAVPEFRFL